MTRGANNTGMPMPLAIVWPWQRGKDHDCHVAPGTGPCAHPDCPRGHDCDTYYTLTVCEPTVLDTLSLLPLPYRQETENRRRRWVLRSHGVLVWLWEEQLGLGVGRPPDGLDELIREQWDARIEEEMVRRKWGL